MSSTAESDQYQAPQNGDPTYIAEGVMLIGNTVSSGRMVVDGEIEGDIECTGLVIGEKGKVTGNVVAEEVKVSGELKGSLKGFQLALHPGCRVDAEICYQSLMIEHGAHFVGESIHSNDPISGQDKSKKGAKEAPKDKEDKEVVSAVGDS